MDLTININGTGAGSAKNKTFIFIDANQIDEDYKVKQWNNMRELYSEFKLTDVGYALTDTEYDFETGLLKEYPRVGAENYKKFTPRRIDGSIISEGLEII